MEQKTAIGIDLGGTNIKGILLNKEGTIIYQAVRHTSDTGNGSAAKGNWKKEVASLVEEIAAVPSGNTENIGLSAPGLPSEHNDCIAFMPGRLPGLENFIWADYLQKQKVWVLNDSMAALMAEASFGAAKELSNVILLTLGTGVGGGILINGKIYQGYYQMAGHLGHISVSAGTDDPDIVGIPGSLEQAIGNETVSYRTCGKYTDTSELVKDYLKQDTFATYVWLTSVRKLSLAICSFCNAISPEAIIIGGGIAKAGEALFKPLNDFIDLYEWRPAGKRTIIKQAAFSEYAGAVGAAAYALQNNISK
ncbi:glucokinase [soil metagenome]